MRLILLFVLVAVFVAAISTGAVNINFMNMTDIEKNIFLDVRLPRVVLAGLVGAALALSGALFQYVMKNPLADSFTTGVSASSAMGAVTAIMLGLMPLIPVFALAGGLAGLYLVYRIASYRGRIQPITMLLSGIVLSTFASATISFMKFLSDDAVSSIIFWLMGGFQSATFMKDVILFVVICTAFIMIRGDYLRLDILCFDDTTASSSGVDVNILRKKLFFFAALLTAFSVGYAGIIGFVGLIIPHILRLGNLVKASYLLPATITGGAAFMIATDLVARTVLEQGQELPVGVITSSIGGVFFLYLLIKRRKELFYFD
jgi:iron complex transport system permease protein